MGLLCSKQVHKETSPNVWYTIVLTDDEEKLSEFLHPEFGRCAKKVRAGTFKVALPASSSPNFAAAKRAFEKFGVWEGAEPSTFGWMKMEEGKVDECTNYNTNKSNY
jgi:hypothetical protein